MKDIEKQVAELISGLKSTNVDKEKLLGFLNTPDGQKLASSFGGNSSVISGILKSMSAEDISKKLRQTDLSKLTGKNIDEMLKKLR